jgi:hypothetical protein
MYDGVMKDEYFYYFQVGEPADDEPPQLISMNGKLVPENGDLSEVRKFPTVRAATNFYMMMEGRYGSDKLRLRSSPPPATSAIDKASAVDDGTSKRITTVVEPKLLPPTAFASS